MHSLCNYAERMQSVETQVPAAHSRAPWAGRLWLFRFVACWQAAPHPPRPNHRTRPRVSRAFRLAVRTGTAGHGVLLWFEVDDFDAAVKCARLPRAARDAAAGGAILAVVERMRKRLAHDALTRAPT